MLVPPLEVSELYPAFQTSRNEKKCVLDRLSFRVNSYMT